MHTVRQKAPRHFINNLNTYVQTKEKKKKEEKTLHVQTYKYLKDLLQAAYRG
jgi:hypothetical protein